MFNKILIANRGEIALRIMNTCHEMGIETVAVYSDADRKAMHVLKACQSVYLGGSEPSESYLNIDKIIAAAKESEAEAVHPGYGFLAENPEFAERCEAEGIIFIGPPSSAIRNLGNKTIARKIMIKNDVPVIPGMTYPETDSELMAGEADKLGYPVLIKAAAGGGGKGMRLVQAPAELSEASISAANEAGRAFGNPSIYLEKYIARPRHIEFQILADKFGNTVHLLERECSIQRRHQKIIEETPSPVMTPGLRERMGNAAVIAARASGYINAGTVEFLLDENENFYFLEVNTRLQVEHPITEMITGLDLVRLQINIAAGDPLPFTQKDIAGRGHAIECRIYAEDPEQGFFPSPGKIEFMKEPSGPGIRNDCGIYSGFHVPVEYDPILSKLIVYAVSREDAVERMLRALKEYVILGVKTPISFLIDILRSDAFRQGQTRTDFIDTHFPSWKSERPDIDIARIAYIIDEIAGKKKVQRTGPAADDYPTPWESLGQWPR
jgi:acetyl-CoA carboxylase, biotin carboxylase subunit